LIALCLSIVLEAITRLIDPPEISNPKLILIVGSLGLASNLAGFLVLGGHGHSHGGEGHELSHEDNVRAAEEGHNHIHGDHSHSHDAQGHTPVEEIPESDGHPGEVFPEAVLAKAKSRSAQQLRFRTSDEEPRLSKDSSSSLNRSLSRASSRKHRRRGSSIRNGRFTNIDDISIHPASFRQDIIAASKPQLDGIESEDNTASEEEEAVEEEDQPTEDSPLLAGSNGKSNGTANGHQNKHDDRPRHDSWHVNHRHNKSKKAGKGGHGHNHSDMGMNAMILHVIGDALGNIGVIVSALIIWLTTWSGRFYADPAVSLFITIIILKSAIPLTSATAKILLQATPDHIEVNDIKEDIQQLPGVISCHHVHVWQLSDTQIVASMHIQVGFPISEASGERYMELAKAVRKCLHAYGIHSATIQPEFCLDKDHDHNVERPGAVGLDGIVGQARCGLDDEDSCLLECVDNCAGKGCCTPKAVEPQHDHSDHDGHTH
jgi:zinc transporter 1